MSWIRCSHPIGKKLYRTRPKSIEDYRKRSTSIVVDRKNGDVARTLTVKRLSQYYYRLIKKDRISGVGITPRNDLKEIGSRYGGWFIPTSLFNSDSVCYCVGCGEDITFDLGLIYAYGCRVHGFDPTPRAIEHVRKVAADVPLYDFHDIGLWDKEDTLEFFAPSDPNHVSHSLVNLQKTEERILVKVKRLLNIMEELCHEKIDLLKIDIEGAEYRVIETVIEDAIDIKILCVEYDEYFHPLDDAYEGRIRNSVNSLIENGYLLAFSEGNGNYTFVKDS